MGTPSERGKGFWERARSTLRRPFGVTIEPTSSKPVYFEGNRVVEHTYTVDRQTFSIKQKEGTKLPRVSQRRLPWSSRFFVSPAFFSNPEIHDVKAQNNTEVVVSRRARVRYVHAEAPDANIVTKSRVSKKAEVKNGGILQLRGGAAELAVGERGTAYGRRKIDVAKVKPGGSGDFTGRVYDLTAEGKSDNPAVLSGNAIVFHHKFTGKVENNLFQAPAPVAAPKKLVTV